MPDDVPPPLIGSTGKEDRPRKTADRESWRTLPLPESRERLDTTILLSRSLLASLLQGRVPRNMDDRWFVFSENGRIYFHRSWTGVCICGAKLRSTLHGGELYDIWFNREPSQYGCSDIGHDEMLLRELVHSLFESDICPAIPELG